MNNKMKNTINVKTNISKKIYTELQNLAIFREEANHVIITGEVQICDINMHIYLENGLKINLELSD